ncbi:MAG: serine hydrolase [Deltaproteobacteria bacterium]|nr:serine hydrolase [Deltaproteobacteria bacterium]
MFSVATGCFPRAGAERAPALPDYWPTREWRTSVPERQGMDSRLLGDAIELIRREELHVNSLLVVRHGYIVLDANFWPFSPGGMHDLASGTKSYVSTLLGMAIDEGYLKSVRQPVLPLFAGRNIANLDADKRAMTVEDVLTMRSGLTCIWSNLGGPMEALMRSPDWVQYILDRPMAAAPGSKFCYSNADSHLLSGIIRAATGRTVQDYAMTRLFGPLGISEVIWPADPQGNGVGYAELRLSARDMAKLGLLFLHRGVWDGRRLISEGWVEEATRAQHELEVRKGDPFDGYGYQWWTSTWGFFTARGRGGQFIAVFPKLDLVLVMTAEIGDDAEIKKIGTLLTRYLLPSAKSDGPVTKNATAAARLETLVTEAAVPHEKPQPLPALPPFAAKVSGTGYVFEKNVLDLDSFKITFSDGAPEARVVLALAGGTSLDLPVGLDGMFRIGKGRFGLPAAMKGHWRSGQVFEAALDELGNNARWSMVAAFDGDEVLFFAAGAGMGEVTIKGRAGR